MVSVHPLANVHKSPNNVGTFLHQPYDTNCCHSFTVVDTKLPIALRGANLSGVNLSGYDLSQHDLRGADLRRANVTGSCVFQC